MKQREVCIYIYKGSQKEDNSGITETSLNMSQPNQKRSSWGNMNHQQQCTAPLHHNPGVIPEETKSSNRPENIFKSIVHEIITAPKSIKEIKSDYENSDSDKENHP